MADKLRRAGDWPKVVLGDEWIRRTADTPVSTMPGNMDARIDALQRDGKILRDLVAAHCDWHMDGQQDDVVAWRPHQPAGRCVELPKVEVTYGTDAPVSGLLKSVSVQDLVRDEVAERHPDRWAVPGYEALRDVLGRAFDQAASGKGAERHAQGQPFDQQPMQDLIRLYGPGFALGQAAKKAQESQRLPRDRAVAELLGAINYLAGAVIALEKGAE